MSDTIARIVRTASGRHVGIGHDLASGKLMPHRISWSDKNPETTIPDAKNSAGWWDCRERLDRLRFVRVHGEDVVIVGDDFHIDMRYDAPPFIYRFQIGIGRSAYED